MSAVPSFRLYRLIAAFFVIGCLFFVGAIVAMNLGRATITLYPATEPLSLDFNMRIAAKADAASDDELVGEVVLTFINQTTTQPVLSTKFSADSGFGTVTLHNESSREQPLVRTTRVLAADGTLVRLTQAVTVPANDTITAAVYPDPDTLTTAPSGRYTIPGLNAQRQIEVYATADQALGATGNVVPVVTEAELTTARHDLTQKVKEAALERLRQDHPEQTISSNQLEIEVVNETVSHPLGSNVTEVTVGQEVRITAVIFDQQELLRRSQERIKQFLPRDRQLMGHESDGFRFELVSTDIDNQQATIKVVFVGQVAKQLPESLVDPNAVVGLTAEQVQAHYAAYPEIKKVDVHFAPFWVSTVPPLRQRIEFRLQPLVE